MRFLADMGVDVRLIEWLRGQGHDATHLRDEGLQPAPDDQVLEKAIAESRVILTFDLDFADLMALPTGGLRVSFFSGIIPLTKQGFPAILASRNGDGMKPNDMTLRDLGMLTEEQARAMLESIRWPNGPRCVQCGSLNVTRLAVTPRPGLFQCNDCRGQFTVTVDTIFEDSHIPLAKWVLAFGLMCSSKKGISALQLQRNLGLGSYKSAWHMAHRIRHAMDTGPFPPKLRGTVEVDETYVGGKTHGGKRGRGAPRKTPVVALVQRSGQARTLVAENLTRETLHGAIREHVGRSAAIMTDDLPTYAGIGQEFQGGHQTVAHGKKEYVRGAAHVNTAESFFSLLKRGIYGTFHHVSKKHLHRYANEFEFRWNHRKVNDGPRTVTALKASEGKRLIYRANLAG